jgi:hypothetical protein
MEPVIPEITTERLEPQSNYCRVGGGKTPLIPPGTDCSRADFRLFLIRLLENYELGLECSIL